MQGILLPIIKSLQVVKMLFQLQLRRAAQAVLSLLLLTNEVEYSCYAATSLVHPSVD